MKFSAASCGECAFHEVCSALCVYVGEGDCKILQASGSTSASAHRDPCLLHQPPVPSFSALGFRSLYGLAGSRLALEARARASRLERHCPFSHATVLRSSSIVLTLPGFTSLPAF